MKTPEPTIADPVVRQYVQELQAELASANARVEKITREQEETTHQLRTPLAAIKWILDMCLHRDFTDDNERQNFIRRAYESTEHMISLVNDLLETDIMQSKKEDYLKVPVDVTGTIASVLAEMQPQITERHLAVVNDLPPGLTVSGDKGKLRELFQNLLENAIKYSPNEGRVSISSSQEKGFLKISIADNGVGIPAEQQDKVFHKFFRARNAADSEEVGTGLGLYIAKQIVDHHGGKIWFESSGEGKGTTFCVLLPLSS